MAMKFDNFFAGANPVKEAVTEEQVAPSLAPTRNFLPVRQYDKDGALAAFVAAPNPYLALKGKINKQAVMNFIAARRAIKSHDLTKAEQLLKGITRYETAVSGPWVLLGDIAKTKKEIDSAVAHYQKAIAVNPDNVNAYLPLALLLREQGQFIAAQNIYAQALAVWKDFPEAHLNLGVLYDLYLNDPLQAQQHMEAYQFLTDSKDEQVSNWLKEVESRTGIQPNLYIDSSITSQNREANRDKRRRDPNRA